MNANEHITKAVEIMTMSEAVEASVVEAGVFLPNEVDPYARARTHALLSIAISLERLAAPKPPPPTYDSNVPPLG